MNKLIYKRIIGLFIFALTFISLGIKDVNAESCEKLLEPSEVPSRYGLTINYDVSKNKYIIKDAIDKDSLKLLKPLKAGDIKFKIAGIYLYELPANSTDADIVDATGKISLAGTQDLSSKISEFINSGIISSETIANNGVAMKISHKIMDYRANNNYVGLLVKLVPDGFKDPVLVASCGEDTTFEVFLSSYVDIGTDMAPKVYNVTTTGSVSGVSMGKINCDNYKSDYKEGSFNYNFCEDKTNALKSGSGTKFFTIKNYKQGNMIKYENDTGKEYKPGDAIAYKCNYKDYIEGVKEGDKYYINRDYLHGEGTITINIGGYKYTGDYSDTNAQLDASCELKCEEVVKVEYGPPVASKAGLCFQYKVKVTSRVNCEMTKEPNKPPEAVACTPTPGCLHTGGKYDGKTYTQAGPNNNFDRCIKQCDGGKYTEKCSNKCYKQVYGNSISKKVAYRRTGARGDLLYEYKYVNNELIWDVGTDKNRYFSGTNTVVNTAGGAPQDRDSYWNKVNKWGSSKHIYNLYVDQGIPSMEDCNASCYWTLNQSDACTDTSKLRYLNDPAVYADQADSKLISDMAYNSVQYEELVKKCSAYAACNTTTSEYTISVDYTKNGTSTKETINFPYTKNNDKNTKDTITSKESAASCPEDATSIILDSDGCYNCGKISENKMYMTEWSFPGTWINNKNGKISYTPVTTAGWRTITEKFCLPLNAADVNQKWFNKYQAVLHGDDTSYSYNNTDYVQGIDCNGGKLTNVCEYKNTKFTSEDAKNIDYNIKATARKFGMYEWDIDISCFYALNSIFPKEKPSDNCSMLTCDDDDEKSDKRVRTADLDDLFPDSEGNKLDDPSKTGKSAPFNWSLYAEQTIKDDQYISTPSNYAKWIQAKGASIYSDEYEDYGFNLTKEDIAKIKKEYNSNKSYTSWEGKTEVNSVVNYQSPLFRNGGILADGAVYPGSEALKCNNIGQHSLGSNYSAECMEFDKEGK